MAEFHDHFSDRSREYAKYRPHYPPRLFEHLAALAPRRDVAWDCATGNGQAATALATYFGSVIATDASAEQIAHAAPAPNLEYRVAAAESSGLADAAIDLVTVATAIHWFDLDAFLTEARRVLRRDGVLCFWTYAWSEMDEEVDAVVRRLHDDLIGPFWSDRVKALWTEGYAGWDIDWPEIELPPFEARAEWTADELLGYMRTWSATQSYARERGIDPTDAIADELRRAYGGRERIAIRWPLQIRAFRLSS